MNEYAEHFAASGAVAERLALTRARPVAGDGDLGARFMTACHPFVYGEPDTEGESDAEVVTVELLTQAFQLRHGARQASLRHAGTLGALDAMRSAGLIADELCRELDHAYVFLQSTEHRRQLGVQEDLQKQVEASRERVRAICATIRRLADW
ncbi:MAG: hypothetical protein EHM55_22970 [Acidobacteria bacterium]|nr:MAG: hypothetical protein EHM55_22970 [Acidobacteriota bacterium]